MALTELKQEAITDFHMTSNDNNVALLGSISQLLVLEFVYETDSHELFPYWFSYVEVPKDRPCFNHIRNTKIHKIYYHADVHETQELALEPLYVNESTFETLKPKAVHLQWAPKKLDNGQSIVALLSSYGTCDVLRRIERTSRQWDQKLCNLNTLLTNDVFPLTKSFVDIEQYEEFKNVVDLYWVTAFAWAPITHAYIIYIANAAGFVVGFKFSADFQKKNEYCKLQTELGRIIYMKTFSDFLLVCSVKGVIKLFKTNHANDLGSLTEGVYLWSREDRVACRKVEVTFCSDLDSYYIVYIKSAHLLACRLATDGTIMCKSKLYVNDVKITDFAALSKNEFIVTSIMGSVRHVWLSSPNIDDLHIEEQIAMTDMDSHNLQILGVAPTPNKHLWTFVLHRNREYTDHSKHTYVTAFVAVCKLNRFNALDSLLNVKGAAFDDISDCAASLRMDILNNFDANTYHMFCELTNIDFPDELNEDFLLKMQIKLLIVKTTAKYQKLIRKVTEFELSFMTRCVEITHILCRLKYLEKLTEDIEVKLNNFQTLAATCMRARFHMLISELITMANEENPLNNTIRKFTRLATQELNTKVPTKYNCSETCLNCEFLVDRGSMLCANNHKTTRCCVSYIQITLLNRRYCNQCHIFALEDNSILLQLYPPGEIVKCTFCRFLFMVYEF